jgi:serine protease Do
MSRFLARVLLRAVLLCISAVPIGQALAQPANPDDNVLTLREALFDELARDAQRFDSELSLVRRVVKLVTPTVVHIDAERKESRAGGYGSQRAVREAGSGIVIELEGTLFVLTNRHVILDAPLDQIKIRLADGRLLTAVRAWSDAGTDVAVIGVADTRLPAARLGNSDQVDIGDFVLAMGSPFGLSHSVSYGIVSAKGRWDLELGVGSVQFQDFLQTDAAINPGNSGGPLLNLRGEVIGMNTAIASNSGGNEGIGFAIPINLAMAVARQLVRRGGVSQAYLGVTLDAEFVPELALKYGVPSPTGALVKAVTPGSPAEAADLRRGDLIVDYNGIRVEDDSHLVNLVSLTPVDQKVAIGLIRGGKPLTVQTQVVNRSDFEPRP